MTLTALDADVWVDAVCVAAARGHEGEIAYIKKLYRGAGGRFARGNPDPPVRRVARSRAPSAADWLAQHDTAVVEPEPEVEDYVGPEPEAPGRRRKTDARVSGSLSREDANAMRNIRTADALVAEQDVDDFVDDAPAEALSGEDLDPRWWNRSAQRWTDSAVLVRSVYELSNGDAGRAFRELIRRYQPYMLAVASKTIHDRALAEEAAASAAASLPTKLLSFDGTAKFTTWLYRVVSNQAKDRLRAAAPAEYNVHRVVKQYRRDIKLTTGEDISEEKALETLYAIGRLKPATQIVSASSRSFEDGGDYEGSDENDPEMILQRKQEAEENLSKLAEQRRMWGIARKRLTPKQQQVLELRHPGLTGQVEDIATPGMSYAEMSARLGVPVGTVMSRLFDARKAWAQDMPATAVAIPKDKRGGGTGVRTNPEPSWDDLTGRDLLAYCETAQDARDLGAAGILSKSEVRSVIRALKGAA